MYTFLNRKWFFDKVYNEYITQHVLSFGYQTTYKLVDRGLFEFLGPLGITKTVWEMDVYLQVFKQGLFTTILCDVGWFNSFYCLVGLWSTISAVFDIRLVIFLY